MRRLAFSAALTLLAATANAHPSVSVVFDSKGNLYFSDLKQVLRVAPNGTQSVIVPNVHTHELYIDEQDNLYGEQLWYEGDVTKKFDHYFWRRSPNGRIDRVVAAHEAFKNERDPSFVRDRAGNQYWAQRPAGPIMKNDAVLARGTFRDIRFMTVTLEGTLYFVDTFDLMRVTPDGRLSAVARNLTTEDWIPPRAHNQIMGLWTDRAGNVYVADVKDKVVKRVTPRGAVSVVARAALTWDLSGGGFAPNGDLWVLEFRLYDARVRRISR
ncbi:MAG TPA: hypothetical protein VGJ78_25150 [Vicinamibacterales bacterium]